MHSNPQWHQQTLIFRRSLALKVCGWTEPKRTKQDLPWLEDWLPEIELDHTYSIIDAMADRGFSLRIGRDESEREWVVYYEGSRGESKSLARAICLAALSCVMWREQTVTH